MRTLFSTLALVAGMSLMAQDADMDNDKKTPEERAKHRTEVMTKELGLNAEQIAKVNTINLNFARAASEVKEIKDEATRKGRSDALKAKRETDLQAVLTADQFTKMKELREKKKDGKRTTRRPTRSNTGQPPHTEGVAAMRPFRVP